MEIQKKMRTYRSEGYNWNYNLEDGFFMRWGKTIDEDPLFSPVGPEILDIEISTICHGVSGPCKWCYKSNTAKGKNMSLETFQKILDKLPGNVIQIAFGIGDIDANPDMYNIFRATRDKGITPNVTINGARMKDSDYENLTICGGVAVSHYGDDDLCFDAVERLKNAGVKQVTIHKLLSEETYGECFSLINKVATDKRTEDLTAIVFLMLKPVGRASRTSSRITTEQVEKLFVHAVKKGVGVGADSCSAPLFLQLDIDRTCIEPCESGLFSLYINVEGEAFPCSFTEPVMEGIDVLACDDFLNDVWYSEELVGWRDKLLASSANCSCKHKSYCRSCPTYNITTCRFGEAYMKGSKT